MSRFDSHGRFIWETCFLTESMNIISLRDATTNSSARIAPALGFNCFEFRADVDGTIVDVIDAAPEFAAGSERPSGHGIGFIEGRV